jgi:hypothetical protein
MIEGKVAACGDGVTTSLVLNGRFLPLKIRSSQIADETNRQLSQDFPGNRGRGRPKAIPRGCLLSIGSALVTCLMLFINGTMVFAFLSVFARIGPGWMRDPRFSQFMLFIAPVLLAVVQWMMIDYVRSRFQQDSEV